MKGSDMALCPGWIKGLHEIYQKAYIAIITSLNSEKTDFINELFKYNNVKVDAIYRRKGEQPYFSQNYSQLIHEFSCNNAVILTAIGLESTEIEEKKDWDLIYQPTLSVYKRINVDMWPVSQSNSPKFCVFLIPNPRAQQFEGCLSLCRVAKIIKKVLKTWKIIQEFKEIDFSSRQDLKLFKLHSSNFGKTDDISYQVMVYYGKESERKPYLRYFYSSIKSQIELSKYRKKE